MYAMRKLSLDGVRKAHEAIKPLIHRTPTLESKSLSQAASSSNLTVRFFLKCENLQKSGSFKFRGASNFMAEQSDADLKKGLVAISTGNFGHAVALAAKTAGQSRSMSVDASVVLPATSPPSKIAGAEANGAKVVLAGTNPEDRESVAKQILHDTGATLVGPMDDPRIVLGQATATLEMIDQVKEISGEKLDAVVLPSATGGILTGAAVVCEGTETMVFGCEPQEGGPDLRRSLASRTLLKPKHQNTVADGLRASTAKGNFEIIQQKNLVAQVYAVTERDIKAAWRMIIDELKLVVEPSSAVSLALVLFNKDFRAMLAERKSEWNIGIVLTGGNTTISRMVKELSSFQ